MHFTPAPPNDFPEFIETYYQRCRERVPAIQGNAGKWTLEDLIPGLSDFDTRFFVSDTMDADGWCRMSTEVGQVHLELATERRDWARNLEHLPGVNLTWKELFDRQFYFTEFSQWTFHHGDASRLAQARSYAANTVWSEADELYHWGKIAIYYGRYDRSIDPAINLGAYENKYPLHSRVMHYLAPPLHSAVCLMQRTTTPGKMEALRQAQDMFPNSETMDAVLDLINRHYEVPKFLLEPGVTEFDDRLGAYITGAVNTLLDKGAPIRCAQSPSPSELKQAVRELRESVGANPLSKFFENVKFSRLMKGRLWFYGQELLWFDSEWLIRNELARMPANFYETPLRLFARHAYGEDVDSAGALCLMQGDILDGDEIRACLQFAELVSRPCTDSELKKRALAVADVFDPFLHVLEKLMDRAAATT